MAMDSEWKEAMEEFAKALVGLEAAHKAGLKNYANLSKEIYQELADKMKDTENTNHEIREEAVGFRDKISELEAANAALKRIVAGYN
jgi:uncharacterized protein YdcH (DUF465 family)